MQVWLGGLWWLERRTNDREVAGSSLTHCAAGIRTCFSVSEQHNLVQAKSVTAGLAESNGSLPPGIFGRTAQIQGSGIYLQPLPLWVLTLSTALRPHVQAPGLSISVFLLH